MTDAAEPVASEEIAAQWRSMGEGLRQAGIDLQKVVFGSETGWTGQAADAMRYRLGQVVDWSMNTGESFTTASSAVAEQSAAVGEAKIRMPEPVPYNPGQMIDEAAAGGLVNIITLPQRMYAQQQKHEAAYDKAIMTVAARDAQLAKGAAVIPAFTAPPALNDDTGSPPPDGSRPTNPSGGSGGRDSTPVGGPGFPSGGPGPSSGGPGAVSSGPGSGGPVPGGPGQLGPGVTTPGSATPASPTGRPVLPVGGIGPGTGSPGGQGSGPGGGFLPGGGVGAVPGFGPGGGASEGGGAARGIGSGSVGGPRGAGAGGPGRGVGGAPGMGTGGAVAEGAAGGRGAAGARGGAGMGGMPLGGGRGQGEEDTEHQRPSWLLEENPESLFGTDEMTAPPVIGAD